MGRSDDDATLGLCNLPGEDDDGEEPASDDADEYDEHADEEDQGHDDDAEEGDEVEGDVLINAWLADRAADGAGDPLADTDEDADEDADVARALRAERDVCGDDELAAAARDVFRAIAQVAIAQKVSRLAQERRAHEAASEHVRSTEFMDTEGKAPRSHTEKKLDRPPQRGHAATSIRPRERERSAQESAAAQATPRDSGPRAPRVVAPSPMVPADRPANSPTPRPSIAGPRARRVDQSAIRTPGLAPEAPVAKASVPPVPPTRTSAARTPPATPAPRAIFASEPTRAGESARRLTGADLAAWRWRLGLTQQALAGQLAVAQSTISKAEGRTAAPLGPTLNALLAAALRGGRAG